MVRELAGLESVVLEALGQTFWEVYAARMPILNDATFQMILGVGPPRSAVKVARRDLSIIKRYAGERKQHGDNPEKWNEIVAHYEAVLTRAKNATQFVKNADVKIMSMCLPKDSGSKGFFIWNDLHPATRSYHFQKVPVRGVTYWSAYMSNVYLAKSASRPAMFLDCEWGCDAVVDTGTSLIVAPTHVVNSIWTALGKWVSDGLDCKNVSSLPSLHFKLGGKPLTLPPQSYVAKVDGALSEEIKEFLPHSDKFKEHVQLGGDTCIPIVMTLDERSAIGPMWILGLPLFRQYYTSFVFGHDFEPDAMYLAQADDNCELDGYEAERSDADTSKHIMRIDASKLRVPQWALQAKARARGRHPVLDRMNQ